MNSDQNFFLRSEHPEMPVIIQVARFVEFIDVGGRTISVGSGKVNSAFLSEPVIRGK